MALDVVAALEKVLTASRRVYLALLFSSSVALFAPKRILDAVSVTAVVNEYKSIPGILFVITACLLAADCLLAIVELLRKQWGRYFAGRAQVAHLKSLTPHEKTWLYANFIHDRRRHCELSPADQIAIVLDSRGVLSSHQFSVGDAVVYTMADWAWTYLTKNPETLLKDEDGTPIDFSAMAARIGTQR